MSAKWLVTCLLARIKMGWCACHDDSEVWSVTRHPILGVSLTEFQLE